MRNSLQAQETVKLKLDFDSTAGDAVKVYLDIVALPGTETGSADCKPSTPASLSEEVTKVCCNLLDSVCGSKRSRSERDEGPLHQPQSTSSSGSGSTEQQRAVPDEDSNAAGKFVSLNRTVIFAVEAELL